MANMQLGQGFGNAESSSQFTRQTFGIADMSIVINLLTKLYHNPKQTLTQEYISNARDANREAKANRPIDITAPSRFTPTMIIRDYGPGLSPERIEQVFLLYGASTKRTDNAQTGGFGIGAKSAWAYVDSFTIVTYVNGVKRTYVAHKSSGNGNLDQIAEEKTTEANGTAIQIPVKPQDIAEFKRAILRTIYFWSKAEQPNLSGFDASDLVTQQSEEIVINPNFSVFKQLPHYIINDSYYHHTFIVIDGIPYEVKSDLYSGIQSLNDLHNKCLSNRVFKVNNGMLHIAPNREDIITDDHNKNILRDLGVKALADTLKYVTKELEKHTDIADALQAFIKMYNTFKIQSEYRGYSVNYGGIKPTNEYKAFTEYELKYSRKSQTHKMYTGERDSVPMDRIGDLYYVDDIAKAESNAKRGYRIRKALEAKKRIIVITKQIDKLVKELKAKPLSDLDASDYQLLRAAKVPIQKKEFCAHYFSGGTLQPKQVKGEDFKEETIYAFMDDKTIYDTRHSNDVIRYLTELGIKFIFVARSNQDHVNSNPKLVHYETWVKNHTPSDKHVKLEIRRMLADHMRDLSRINNIATEIKDKTLATVLEMFKVEKQWGFKLPKDFEANVKKHKLYKELKSVLDDVPKFDKQLEKKYPLLHSFSTISVNSDYRKHVIEYINTYA